MWPHDDILSPEVADISSSFVLMSVQGGSDDGLFVLIVFRC